MNAPRGRRWIAFVIALLALQVVGSLALVLWATNDPSHYVVPNYYQRALRHDEEMAQSRRNLALGWQLQAALTLSASGRELDLDATLRSAQGAPLAGAQVDVSLFALARAGRSSAVHLLEQSPGRYRARISAARVGVWRLQFTITRGSDRYTATLDREVASARL